MGDIGGGVETERCLGSGDRAVVALFERHEAGQGLLPLLSMVSFMRIWDMKNHTCLNY